MLLEKQQLCKCFFNRVKIIWKKNIVLQHQHSVIALHHKNKDKAPAYRAVIVDPIALHHCFFLRLNLLEPGDFVNSKFNLRPEIQLRKRNES